MKKKTIEILFEDEYFIAVNKPSGTLVIPDRAQTETNTLQAQVAAYLNNPVFVVHRIDRETSGVLLFAKTAEAHKALNALFQENKIVKKYQALVCGKVQDDHGDITFSIAEHVHEKGMYIVSHAKTAKPSHTEYDVLERFKNYTLLELTLHTGRTHQIRVHCKAIGHPLAIDKLYMNAAVSGIFLSEIKKKFKLGKHTEEEKPIISRLTLHAASLTFTHPFTQETILVKAPFPKDFAVLLKCLKENG